MAERKQGYTFAAEPRAVGTRKKYRDPYAADLMSNTNIMWDKRVVRGNTYAAQPVPVQQLDNSKDLSESKRRRARQKLEGSKVRGDTPEPVEGRQHMDVQTDQYLEELVDRPLEADVDTQTDPFLDRPASPLFVPKKSGIDISTQIYENDLFDFDFEVEPLLEILVGKTLEQSMLEVLQEEELAAMRTQQREFEQLRNAELAETQRMEAAEKRRHEEKERRKAQEEARLERERVTKEKLAARTFAKSFLESLEPNVFGALQEQGFFYDVVEREVETDFLPWLVKATENNIEKKRAARAVVDDLLKAALRKSLQGRRAAVIAQ